MKAFMASEKGGSVGVTKYIEFPFVSRNPVLFVPGRVGWEVLCALALFSGHSVLAAVCSHSYDYKLIAFLCRLCHWLNVILSYDIRFFTFRLY